MASSGGNGLIDLLSGGTGSYFLDQAGQAVGRADSQTQWGPEAHSKAFWLGTHKHPDNITPEEVRVLDDEIPDDSWIRPSNSRGSALEHRRRRAEEQRLKEKQEFQDNVVRPSQEALDNAEFMFLKSYESKGDHIYRSNYGPPLRDPFQPLPGMQHNPDPNADPFAAYGPVGKQMGAYQRARNAGMDHDQALKHARAIKPPPNLQPIPNPPQGQQVVPNYPQAKKGGQ